MKDNEFVRLVQGIRKRDKLFEFGTASLILFGMWKNCVKCGTLQIYQELYEKANGDLNIFFEKADKLPGVRSEIIEENSIYHLYFMECTCMLYQQGYVSTPLLCECSKQSILYILHSLWKDKKFSVSICESILRGVPYCKMQIEITNDGNT